MPDIRWARAGRDEQVLDQAVLGTTFIGLGGCALAHQIAQGLVLWSRHPDRREVSTLVGLGELLGIPAIGLTLSPAFLGMSDGAMTSQSTPSLVSCQYNA